MGDLANDTAVERRADGVYAAEISTDWEWIGPHGGYLAALTLRAAGAHATLPRPVSLSCQYLRTPAFAPVELHVEALNRTARAETLRVRMLQDDAVTLEATVRAATDGLWGPDESWGEPPEGPLPEELPQDNAGAEQGFWRNFDIRDIPQPDASRPYLKGWKRFTPRAVFPEDLWADAGRPVIAMDVIQFPSIGRVYDPLTFLATTLDMHVQFHRPAAVHKWLLVEAEGAAAASGLVAGRARVWSPDGALLATGVQQMLVRPMPGAKG